MPKFGSKFAKHFVKNEVLVPHINNWFANADFPEELVFTIHPNKEKDDAFHPSSALMCSRALCASLDGVLPDTVHAMEAQKNFLFGHFSHSVIQYICVEALGFSTWDDIEKEYNFHLETPKGNSYRVRGFIDIARCTIPNKGTKLVDIKTMTARVYAQENPPDSLIEKYEAQVQLYLDFEGLDEAIILFAEKDNPHRFKERVVQRDDEFVDQTVQRWESVVDARAEGRIPDCTCWDPNTCPALNIYDTQNQEAIRS